MRFRHSMFFIVCSVIALIATGCEHGTETEASNPSGRSAKVTEFATVMVESKPYVEKIELPGSSVRGFETTQLMAKVGGYVKKINSIDGDEVDVGTLVTKGGELAQLDVPEMMNRLAEKYALVEQAKSLVTQADAAIKQAEAGVAQKKAAVKQAEAEREAKNALLKLSIVKRKRIEDLVKQKSIGAENLDEARFAVDSAQAAVSAANADIETSQADVVAAEADLEKAKADKSSADANVKVAEAAVEELKTLINYSSIKAPFDGVITKRMVDHGAFVRPATSNSGAMPLFEITRIDKVRVLASVPNLHATKVGIGQKAVFHSIGGMPGVQIAGKVTRIAHALDPDSRMMRIEVHLKNPLEQPASGRKILLHPGMFGSVTVVIKDWEDLPIVPSSAIQTDNSEQAYLYVVGADRVAHRQNVEIAYDDAKTAGIRDGVKPGKLVVSQNVTKVEEGQLIPANSP